MATILDYYKYAALATAAYVRLGTNPWDGATFAAQASDPTQSGGRLPLSIAQYLFDPPAGSGITPWQIVHYHGSDLPGHEDVSGFAATLFERSTEEGSEKALSSPMNALT
jgi:hypothetical protein